MSRSNPALSWQRRRRSQRQVGVGARKFVFGGVITLLLFGAIVPRLSFLQLTEGPLNRQRAEENRVRLIPKRPERGKILDRKGRLLANSTYTYSVFVWPIAQKEQKWSQTLQVLSEILKMPAADIQGRVEQEGHNATSLVRVAKGLSFPQVVALSERMSDIVGVEIDKEAIRYYPNGELASQVIGYIGEIGEEELARPQEKPYRLGDVVGQLGVEASYEQQLRGTWGGNQIEVDGAGRIVKILGQKPPIAGDDVKLTLDLEVQKAAEQALKKRQGAIVAINPKNGAVIAMASYPGFNPNWFAKGLTDKQWQMLQNRKFPFINRGMQAFPPASTFKIATAIAAIESGKYSPNTRVATSASVHGVGDWNGAGFGVIGFPTALQWSSNTFFGRVAVGTTPKVLIDWAQRLGVGERTGLDLPGEARGFIPDPAWKKEVYKDAWYPADTVMVSIGQGAVQLSPVQVSLLFAAIANGGYKVKPHLRHSDQPDHQWQTSLHIKPPTLNIIRSGLRAVVTSGTGQALNVPSIPPAAGKSGTAEDPPRPSHTWFGAYAPFNNPEIVVVAFGENTGGGGGSTAGPMALKVLEAYFKAQKK